MAASIEEQISPQLVEEWARYLEPSRGSSFRQACAGASMRAIENVIRPFFAVWKTSLMHSDVERLRSISMDNHLRAVLETIIIQDDCEKLDPWTSSELPSIGSSYNIWPRNEAGIVSTNLIDIINLTTMLHEGVLCPKTIRIRDYQIAEVNFRLAPEMVTFRDLIRVPAPATAELASVAVFAKDVIEGANLAVTSLAIQHASLPLAESSVIHSGRFKDGTRTSVLGDPKIEEAIIGLSPESQGRGVGFSLLRSAELLLGNEGASYWLEQIFYTATTLKTLALSIKSPCSFRLNVGSVVPELTEFSLANTTTSANEIVAIIASSKKSLKNISFRQVTLYEGSTWRELLTFISNEYQALTSITLRVLREKEKGYLAIDFRDLKEVHLPETCRSGLDLIEKGPPHNRRVTSLSHNGPNEGNILGIIARHV